MIDRRSLLAAAGALVACPAGAAPVGPLVLAAASLRESLTAAGAAWAAKGHAAPVCSFAASSALARQIEAGARADLFVSADEAWMDDVERRGRVVAGTRVAFLANRLAVVHARGLRGRYALPANSSIADLLHSGRIAIADPDSVPAGRYARAALERLGLWAQVAPRLVRAENVRAALALVERGAAHWGIVYETDARISQRVTLMRLFPPGSHPLIRYPLARLRASTDPDAEALRRFLIGREARAIFARYGFGTP